VIIHFSTEHNFTSIYRYLHYFFHFFYFLSIWTTTALMPKCKDTEVKLKIRKLNDANKKPKGERLLNWDCAITVTAVFNYQPNECNHFVSTSSNYLGTHEDRNCALRKRQWSPLCTWYCLLSVDLFDNSITKPSILFVTLQKPQLVPYHVHTCNTRFYKENL